MAPVLRRASMLSVKTYRVAVGCGVLLLGAVSAHAGASLHGTPLQGVQLNGIALQGVAFTGVTLHGISLHGRSCTGTAAMASPSAAQIPGGTLTDEGMGG